MSHSALTFFHSKQTVVNLQVGHYHFTDLGYADATVLMSDQPQADSVLHQSIPFLLHWAKSYRDPRQNSNSWVQVTEVTRRRQSS